jgi:hypothetical protein
LKESYLRRTFGTTRYRSKYNIKDGLELTSGEHVECVELAQNVLIVVFYEHDDRPVQYDKGSLDQLS